MVKNIKFEKRITIALISLTVLAYTLKTFSSGYECLIEWGNILVVSVNLGLLIGTTAYPIVKALIFIFTIASLFLMIIFNVEQNCIEALLNGISIVAISFTFWDIHKSYISSKENNKTN